MIEVLFLYETQNIIIQCNTEDKLKDVAQKLKIKINEEDNDDLFYVYEGDKINEELTIKQIIKNKNINQIKILVFDSSDEENEKKIVSNEIICPICKENILIKIRDYQIDLYGCKNQHKLENVLLYEFENSQKIDLSKIICGMCTIKNISMIAVIILFVIMIKIIYVKSIMINLYNIVNNVKRIYAFYVKVNIIIIVLLNQEI